MKKAMHCLLALLMLVTFYSTQATAATVEKPAISITDSTEKLSLLVRLNEIKNLDKSHLSSSDKKALRKELRGLKKQMQHDDRHRGIYISVGAAIIIVILLIILL